MRSDHNTVEKVLANYKVDPTTNCWVYQGSHAPGPTAVATIKRERWILKKLLWQKIYSTQPKQRISTVCGNGMCINPKHICLEYSEEYWKGRRKRIIEQAIKNYNVVPKTGCWEYQGNTSIQGYGRITIKEERLLLHRLAWEEANKQAVPKDLLVRHSCDNPCCINPKHLSIGTHHDNMQDAISRSRHSHGENRYNTKITEKDVHAIRASNKTLGELSKEFNLAPSTLSQIRNHQRWKHIK